MEEQQLQMGEIEEMENGVPKVVAQSSVPVEDIIPQGETSEEAPAFVPGELPIEELADDTNDPLSMMEGDPLAPINVGPEVPASMGQAEEVADLYNMAGMGTLSTAVTPSAIMQSLEKDVTSEDIRYLLQEIDKEDEATRKEIIMATISNPKLGIDQRLQLVQQLDGFRPHDINRIMRQALSNLNQQNAGESLEEQEDFEAAEEYIQSIPNNIDAIPPSDEDPEDIRRAYEATLNLAFSQADEDAGFVDFMATMIPFRYQGPVMKIYHDLGLDSANVTAAGGHLLMGEALKLMREHVESLPVEEKAEALALVLKTLTPNGGLFKDGNDWVTTHVLNEVFYKDLYGEDYFKQATKEERDSYFQAKARKEQAANRGDLKEAARQDALMSQIKAKASGAMPGTDQQSFTQFMDNTGSLFDLMGLGALARGTIKLGSKWLPTSVARKKRVNPEQAAKDLTDALTNPAVREKFGGLMGEEIVERFLPSMAPAVRDGGVNGLGELITRQLDIRERLLRVSNKPNMAAIERADAFAEIRKEFDEFAVRPRTTLHINESLIEAGEQGVDISAVFGRTTHKPYSSLRQAQEARQPAIEELFGKDAPVEIVWRNPKTGKLEPAKNLVAELPPVPAGSVRVYTGSVVDPAESVGARAFARDKAYAEGIAARSGGKVYYLDIPAEMLEEDLASGIVGKSRLDVPEELAKGAVPVPDAGTVKGEFFLQVKDSRAYDSAPSAYHSLAFGDKDIRTTLFGSKWNTFLPAGSIFRKEIFDGVAMNTNQRFAFNNLSLSLVKDVTRLGGSQQKMLSKILKEGEEVNPATGRGTTYTPTQLREKGLSEDGIKAYYSYRGATDVLYDVVNRQTRTKYLRDGVKDIQGKGGRIGFGKPLPRASDAISDINVSRGRKDLDVYDAETNTYIRMDAAAVNKLYADGDSIARLNTPMLGKGGEASHVILSGKKGVRALGIPHNVVTRVEGYYPHMWSGNFIAYGITKAGNRVALGISQTEKEAAELVRKMNEKIAAKKAAGKSSRFDEVGYSFDRSLSDVGQRGAMMEDLYVNMGGPVYGQRNGGRLRNISKSEGDAMVEPIEALVRGMEIVGQSVTKGELAANMRQRLYNYARTEGILKNNDMIPRTLREAEEGGVFVDNLAKRKSVEKAKAYLKQIETLEFVPDTVDQHLSAFFARASNILASIPGAKGLSRKAADLAGRGADPMGTMMGLFHRFTIASNPIGQFALQGMQSLMLLGVAPAAYMQAVRQSAGMYMLVGFRSLGLHGGRMLSMTADDIAKEAKTISKAVGIPADELMKLTDTIIESGLIDATGHHSAMRASVRSAAEERMRASARALSRGTVSRVAGNFARGADAATFGAMSKVGFEGGENLNRITTLLTFYNRDKARGVANLADPDYVRSLIGNVTEVTGSMIPEMGFSYQRGWLKAAFQFVSFQHKMVALMLPEKIGGSRVLTGKDKFGMVVAQFLLFGRRGAAHTDALYRAIENEVVEQEAAGNGEGALVQAWRDPDTQAFMQGYLLDYQVNQLIQGLTDGEVPEFDISARFAPGGGSEFIAERLFELSRHPITAFFGLAGERGSEIYKYMKRSYEIALAQTQDLDNIPVDERAEELVKKGGTLMFSAYNRHLAVEAAKKYDGYISAGGSVTEGFSGDLEEALFKHFGIMTKDRESLYQAMDKYGEDMQSDSAGGKKDKELQQLAQEYYANLIFRAVKLDKETPSQAVWENLMDEWVREQGLLFSMLPPDDAARVSDLVHQRVSRTMENPDSAERVFVERLTSKILSNGFGSDGPKVGKYLEQAEFVRNNPALKDIVINTTNFATEESLENQ